MVLYAPYEARYMVAFVLRDHLNKAASAPKLKNSPLRKLGLHSHLIDLLEESVSRQDAFVRRLFQKMLSRYAEGTPVSSVLLQEDAVSIHLPLVQTYAGDANALLLARSKDRKDIFCKTPEAKLIAVREAWRDISAMSCTFHDALEESGPDFQSGFDEVAMHIEQQRRLAEEKASTVVELSSSRDYEVAPNP